MKYQIDEVRLIDMIRNSKDPARAMETAIKIILEGAKTKAVEELPGQIMKEATV